MKDRGIPTLRVQGARQKTEALEITDEELLLSSPIVYGFSLSDKIWRKSYVLGPVAHLSLVLVS